MKRRLKIFTILTLYFTNVNAHNPSNDSLCVYIDNIFVGKRCCVDFRQIPSILLENYYCNDLLKCIYANSSLNDAFSMINPKAIKEIFIEKKEMLNVYGNPHIRTKKAKDGYLFVNRSITCALSNQDYQIGKVEISYVYNGKVVTTREEVMKVLKLRANRIRALDIVRDETSGKATVYVEDKRP